MIRVALCIVREHDLRLIALALLVCLIGSAASVQLFSRARTSSGRGRLGWVTLAAVSAATMA